MTPRPEKSSDPVDNIEWRDASTLDANNYNPNMVFGPELALLERSILMTGWVQPILITKAGIIVDGFHRWKLAQDSKRIAAAYGGKVPCAVVDLDRPQAMLLTVRINRAKGSHAAVKMSELVRELLDVHGMDRQEVANGIGATLAEVDLLHQEGVFKMKNIKDYKYGRAWVPADNTLGKVLEASILTGAVQEGREPAGGTPCN